MNTVGDIHDSEEPGFDVLSLLQLTYLQDREERAIYLQKIFDAVGSALGVPVPANPFRVPPGLCTPRWCFSLT